MEMGILFGLQTALNKQTRPMSGREKGIQLTKDTSWIIANREPGENDLRKIKEKLVWGRRRLASLSILDVASQLGYSGLDAGNTGFDSCENS